MFQSRPFRSVALSVISALLAVGCSSGAGPDSSGLETTGSLSVALELGNSEIDEVAWEITGGDMEPMSGTIDTSAEGATASVEVFGLPPTTSDDYTITMAATTTDGETTCKGSADFGIDVGQITAVMVFLNCKGPERFGGVRVNGEPNVCAELLKAVISPLQTSVGYGVQLSSAASDAEADPVTYLWTGTGGTIANPATMNTTYTCGEVGMHSVTISVSDDDFEYCESSWTVTVECVSTECTTGEECDDGNQCTINSCPSGMCIAENAPAGQSCDQDGGSVCDGEGGCVECNEDEDCAATEMCTGNMCVARPECTTDEECDDGNQCTFEVCEAEMCLPPSNVPEGELCNEDGVCDGAGNCVGCIDDQDCAPTETCTDNVCVPRPECTTDEECDDANQCTLDVCEAEMCLPPSNVPEGELCSEDGVCDGAGNCVGCIDDQDCAPTETCMANVCIARPQCTVPEDCGDTGNDCTVAICQNQICDVANAQNGTACENNTGTCSNGRCIGCAADSWGDPHLVTFDRRHYDLQTVGEYVLARSPLEGFEIQARTSPWGASRTVSVNIAIAANVGGDIVSVYANSLDIYINRVPVSVSGRVDLPGGGYVNQAANVVDLVWPSGDWARVKRSGSVLNLHVQLTPATCGDLLGLLGDGDGDPQNDLLPRGSMDPLTSPVSFEDLLNVFGDSWRITQEESLLEYPPGQGTADFTDLTFPDRLWTVTDLPPELRAAAEEACRARGITDAVLLEACILDYAETQDPSFLDVYDELEPPVETTTPWVPGRVRVAHLAPDFPTAEDTTVDVYIDGELSQIQNLKFEHSSGFIELPPGDYVFGIAPAGQAPEFSFPASVMRAQDTTAVAIRSDNNRGQENPIGVLIFDDSPGSAPAGFGRFAAGHGADDTSIAVVDGINAVSCPEPVFANFTFGTVQGPGSFAVGVEPGALAAPGSCEPLAGPWAAPTYPNTTSLAIGVDLDAANASLDVVGYVLIGDAQGRIPIMPFLTEEPEEGGCNVGRCTDDAELRGLCEAALSGCLNNIGDPSQEDRCFLGAPVICATETGASFETRVLFAQGPFADLFPAGAPATISFEVDGTVPDSRPDPQVGRYVRATRSLIVEVPSIGLAADLSTGTVSVFDNTSNPDDQVFFFAFENNNGATLGGELITLMELDFIGTTDMLDSDAILQTVPPNIVSTFVLFSTASGTTIVDFVSPVVN